MKREEGGVGIPTPAKVETLSVPAPSAKLVQGEWGRRGLSHSAPKDVSKRAGSECNVGRPLWKSQSASLRRRTTVALQ